MNAQPSIRHHAAVAAALLLLLFVTVGAAFVDLGWLNTPVAMGVSIVKGGLILMFFMNIRKDGGLAMLFAAAGLFWLAILFTLSMSDFLTR